MKSLSKSASSRTPLGENRNVSNKMLDLLKSPISQSGKYTPSQYNMSVLSPTRIQADDQTAKHALEQSVL
jgi:hypothetical protein